MASVPIKPTSQPNINETTKIAKGGNPIDGMENNNSILVTVQDSAIGINAQIKNHLFEKIFHKITSRHMN